MANSDGSNESHSKLPTAQAGSINALDFLWRTMARYDFYIGSTNQKATATIAYNTLVVGGLLLKYREILQLYDGHPKSERAALYLLVTITSVCILSIWTTFFMILPYLWSPKRDSSYWSNVFYDHVSRREDPNAYLTEIRALTEEGALRDLAFQTYAVAKGASKKFKWMRLGIFLILFVQLPSLMLLLGLKLVIALH